MLDFATLKRNLKKDQSNLLKVKVALVGDSSVQLLVQAIKGYGVEAGINFEIFEAGYDQVDQLIFDNSSELYEFNPDHIVIFKASEKLLSKFYKSENNSRVNFASDHISWLTEVCNSISKSLSSEIIYLNFPVPLDMVYGNYSNKMEASFSYQLRKLNFGLMKLSSDVNNLFICDLCAIQDQSGRNFLFDPKMYINAGMVLSIDALPFVAKSITDIVSSLNGRFKKCLVLDLDNVMWGGVIGDDGIENIQIGELGIGKAFTEFQLWVKQLKNRGILLAVCSNNEEAIAKEPFEKHPDMILSLQDIAVFVANRESKVDNIKEIQRTLNIGFDAMVFIDDDPFERNLVRTYIPQIEVPDLPKDPAKYLEFFRPLNLFETCSVTEEDEQRTAQYLQESKRSSIQRKYTNQDDFLAGLDMICTIESFNKFNIPRVAQLSQRSNQFNLRTVRYTEPELHRISDSTDFITLVFTLEDRFGDSGIVSAVILKKQDGKKLFIDTWLMSCRVLKRGMEHFVLNSIVKCALQNGFDMIIGEYIPTPKNKLVKDHYSVLGFKNENACWILNTKEYREKAKYIRQK
ncbi:MAG: HAD-IIIC family phosphatase [Bacteroidetes bacterium]|nr:HAD-IIIC family phosphatase [Bacteroidota bacterium]